MARGRVMMMMLMVWVVLGLAGAAGAGPRDSGTFTNLDSDGLGGGNPALRYVTISGSYTARFVRIQGQLQSVIPTTFGYEAALRLGFPTAGAPEQVVLPAAAATYTTLGVDTFVRVQPAAVAGPSSLQIATFEMSDDGPGPDARWNTLTVTLNDGPPPVAANFGIVERPVGYSTPLAAGGSRWFAFTLTSDVSAGSGTYLDIDTEGSAVGGGGVNNDTEIALYNSEGQVVGFDDDDGSGYLSQLSYGAGTRPAVGNGVAYNGRDGSLAAGTYWLRVGGYVAGSSPQVGWDYAATGAPQAGMLRVNIRTNAGPGAFCPGDFNRNGSMEVQDIFDYLNAWFAGCV